MPKPGIEPETPCSAFTLATNEAVNTHNDIISIIPKTALHTVLKPQFFKETSFQITITINQACLDRP